jgi:dCMP deaminase
MKEDFFIRVLKDLRKESKCVSRQVACLIVRDGRIISTGYNGTLTGAKNCNEIFDCATFERETHHAWSLVNEIHAEQNAIAVAAKHGVELDNCICYCSLQPCNTCLLLLIQCGIKEIVYLDAYDKCDWSEDLMNNIKRLGIKLRQVK